jgi:hypothetical protein
MDLCGEAASIMITCENDLCAVKPMFHDHSLLLVKAWTINESSSERNGTQCQIKKREI